jgi:hypothetical protein
MATCLIFVGTADVFWGTWFSLGHFAAIIIKCGMQNNDLFCFFRGKSVPDQKEIQWRDGKEDEWIAH